MPATATSKIRPHRLYTHRMMLSHLRLSRLLPAILISTLTLHSLTAQKTSATEAGQWVSMPIHPQSLIIIPIILNGEPVQAMLDTGVPEMTIDRSWATQHHLKLKPSHQVRSISGVLMNQEETRLASITIGQVHREHETVQVSNLAGMSQKSGIPLQAIIGASLLRNYAIDLDFDHQRMRLLPSGTQPPAGDTVSISFRDAGNRYLLNVRIGQVNIDSVILDTGDNNLMAFPPLIWDTLPHDPKRTTDIAAIDLAGKVRFDDYQRLDNVHIGTATLNHVGTAVARTGVDTLDHGRIGLGLLRRFNAFIDVTAGNMVLTPRLNPEREPVTLTGIQGPFTDTGQQVFHVMKNSPAAQAGLHDGDRICSIDHERIQANWTGTEKAQWGWGPPGKHVSLGMCDNRTIPLTLTEFY